MTTARYGGRNGKSALSLNDAEEIDLSVDRWIARLEAKVLRRATADRSTPRSSSAQVTGDDREAPAGGGEPHAGPRAEQPPSRRSSAAAEHDEAGAPTTAVRVRADVVDFLDAFGGTIVLRRGSLGLVHQGSISVRSPGIRIDELCARYGLTAPQTRALEFVAAWFGAAFDAANIQTRADRRLTWGCWHFSGSRLARCLTIWKERAGDSFEFLVRSHGIDVSAPGPEDPSGSAAVLVAADPRTGSSRRGRSAENIIVGTPVLLAALARAGRHRDAQAAQVETIVRDELAVLAAIALRVAETTTTLADALRSARVWSVLCYLDLRFGGPRVARILTDVARKPLRPGAETEGDLIQRLRSYLAQGGLHEAALQVERVISSPELGDD